jgi:hypothetical protein
LKCSAVPTRRLSTRMWFLSPSSTKLSVLRRRDRGLAGHDDYVSVKAALGESRAPEPSRVLAASWLETTVQAQLSGNSAASVSPSTPKMWPCSVAAGRLYLGVPAFSRDCRLSRGIVVAPGRPSR